MAKQFFLLCFFSLTLTFSGLVMPVGLLAAAAPHSTANADMPPCHQEAPEKPSLAKLCAACPSTCCLAVANEPAALTLIEIDRAILAAAPVRIFVSRTISPPIAPPRSA